MPIRFPGRVQTPAERHDFLLRLQERLRRFNNAVCAKLRTERGVAAARRWHDEWFGPRDLALCRALVEARASVFHWKPKDIDDVAPWLVHKREVRALSMDALNAVSLDVVEPESYQATGLDPKENIEDDYIHVDDAAEISASGTRVSWTDRRPRYLTSYYYKDFGTGHFGDFDILVDSEYTSGAYSTVWEVLGLDTQARDGRAREAAAFGLGVITCYNAYEPEHRYSVRDYASGSVDDSVLIANGSTRYLRWDRSGSILRCRIYPTSADRDAGTNLEDTISVACATTAYSHLHAAASWDTNSWGYTYTTGWIDNIDLQEAAPTGVAPQFMHLARMRRA